MRYSLTLLAWTMAAICLVESANAEIAYHFLPALNGQPSGCAQGAQVAPEVGPSGFKVTLTGALCSSIPSEGPQTAYAYLDKWGLGVLNPLAGLDQGITGQVELNVKNGGEFMQLEFPTDVRLTYLTFASVGSADMIALEADDDSVDMSLLFPNQSTIKEISLSQGAWPGHIDFSMAANSLPFAKKWDVICTAGDGIQLENVGVEPIPEPSTLILWLVGLGVVGTSVVRQRNQTAA